MIVQDRTGNGGLCRDKVVTGCYCFYWIIAFLPKDTSLSLADRHLLPFTLLTLYII